MSCCLDAVWNLKQKQKKNSKKYCLTCSHTITNLILIKIQSKYTPAKDSTECRLHSVQDQLKVCSVRLVYWIKIEIEIENEQSINILDSAD